ncbi:hypothetical protein R83H12_00718 [Fibrobacteria bacterium R8-3-H12]
MKKSVFLPIFAIATFISMTGFMISNLGATTDKHKASWGKYFNAYVYDKVGETGTSLSNEPASDGGYNIVYTDGGESVFKISYTVAADGGAGLGLDAPGNGNAELEGCTAFKYKYKGSHAHNFNVKTTEVGDGQEHFKEFEAADDWQEANVPIADLSQPEWVSSSSRVDFQLNKVEKFAWLVKTAGTGTLSIKDFKGVDCAGIASSSSVGASSSAGSGNSSSLGNSSSSLVYSGNATIIDDFEDGRSLSKLGGWWYIYTDKDNGGLSTVDNEREGTSGYKVLVNDGGWYAKIISYALDKGTNIYQPFVALGVKNKIDLSGCTSGFKYDYKGAKHNFIVKLSKVTDEAHYFKEVALSGDWNTVSVAQSDLKQPTDWGVPRPPFDASLITEFAWEVKGGVSATKGDLSIDNFACLGTFSLPSSSSAGGAAASSSSAGGAAASSSSAGGASPSSSSVGGASPSSSSVGGASPNSSSGGASPNSSSSGTLFEYCVYATEKLCTKGPFATCQPNGLSNGLLSNECPFTTPIIKLPHVAHSNALNAVHNGINLQSTHNASVQIFDLKGNAVRTLKFEPGSYVVQLADLPRGLYVVKAASASWGQTVKMAVK